MAQAEAMVVVTAEAVVARARVATAAAALAVAVNTLPDHKVPEVPRVRAKDRVVVPIVIAHPLVTSNHAATKAALPRVAAWASHALPAPQPVDNPTRCVPVSI